MSRPKAGLSQVSTPWPSRVFLSGQAVSLLGDGLAVLAIPLLVLGLTRSPLISGLSAASMTLGSVAAAHSPVALGAASLAYLWAITVASLANRTYRQLIVPRALLGRVTSTVRLLFRTADPVGVVIAGSLTAALGGNPRPVFLGAGAIVAATAAAGWGAGLRRAGPPGGPS